MLREQDSRPSSGASEHKRGKSCKLHRKDDRICSLNSYSIALYTGNATIGYAVISAIRISPELYCAGGYRLCGGSGRVFNHGEWPTSLEVAVLVQSVSGLFGIRSSCTDMHRQQGRSQCTRRDKRAEWLQGSEASKGKAFTLQNGSSDDGHSGGIHVEKGTECVLLQNADMAWK